MHEILQENELYEDVIDQINRKLALRQAIDKASEAIERSKQGSAIGSNYGASDRFSAAPSSKKQQQDAEARSKASAASKLSLISLSQKGK